MKQVYYYTGIAVGFTDMVIVGILMILGVTWYALVLGYIACVVLHRVGYRVAVKIAGETK